MKRNVISLLLALVLVFAVTVALVPTAEAAVPTHDHSTGWTAMTASVTAEDGGMYYLNEADVAGAITIPAGTVENPVEVTLCLNGYSLRAQKPIAFSDGGYQHLTICDCGNADHKYDDGYLPEGAETTGIVVFSTPKQNYGLVHLKANQTLTLEGGTLYSTSTTTTTNHARAVHIEGGIFNMTGGNVVGTDLSNNYYSGISTTSKNGLAVYIDSNGQFNLSGGTVYAGTVKSGVTTNGAAVCVTEGTVNQSGGLVTGGYVDSSSGKGGNVYIASDGKYNLTDGTIGFSAQLSTMQAKCGGNVCVNGGEFNMGHVDGSDSTATLQHGFADQAGNLYIEGAGIANIYSGTIYRGVAKNGGNIRVQAGVLNVSGGHIYNGIARGSTTSGFGGNAGNIALANNTGCELNVTGGTIETGAAAKGENILIIGGTATITGGEIGIGNSAAGDGHGIEWNATTGTLAVGGTAKITEVYLTATKLTLAATPLAAGAQIGVNAEENYEFLTTADTTLKKYFVDFNGELAAAHNGTGLVLSTPVEGHVHCWCEGAENAPTHTCNSEQVWFDSETLFASNKLSMTAEHPYVYLSANIAGSLDFTNAGEQKEFFLCLNGNRIRGNTPLTVPAGITLTICDCGSNGRIMTSNSVNGANIVTVNGTLKWMSGTIMGKDEANGYTGRCVIVNSNAAFELYGGVVENGTRGNLQGGNILVNGETGVFRMHGGVVRDGNAGTANGGNISIASGSCYIYGGEITGGSAANGGNIYTKGSTTIKNAEITGGTATSNGENIRVDGATVTLENVTVTAVSSENTGDYNISVGNTNSVFAVNGGEITGGYEAIRFGAGTSFTLDGAVKIESSGRELYLAKDKNVTLGANLTNAGTNKIRATKVNLAGSGETPWDGSAVTFGTGAKAEYAAIFAGGANGRACIVYNSETGNLEFVKSTAQIEGSTLGYATLAEALAMNPTTSIQLNKDIDEAGLTLTSNVYINLNGCDITNAISSGSYALNIYDSTNKDYVGEPGSYAGTNATEFFTVEKEVSGAETLRRYLNIDNGDGTYSPHRVYLSVTAVSVNPGKMLLNYKTMFIGDEDVKAYVEQEGYYYGLKFTVQGVDSYMYYTTPFTAYVDKNEASYTQKLTGVQVTDETTADYAVAAAAFIAKGAVSSTSPAYLADASVEEIATSATTAAYSFKGLVKSADASANVGDNAKTALYNMFMKPENAYMASWELQNIPTKWGTITE